ncbi:hypothetical protein K1T71_006158 [Dendrolimus kikuchii]|uniref:Uncharacterized protein n=1 Tax=Dendrolimus kikuchii TaxID=765133 RepID=A0ACC1D380_9NEOP|nr:hypothetical protein K1T71_006158 [Dendrolimus kikuchii]
MYKLLVLAAFLAVASAAPGFIGAPIAAPIATAPWGHGIVSAPYVAAPAVVKTAVPVATSYANTVRSMEAPRRLRRREKSMMCDCANQTYRLCDELVRGTEGPPILPGEHCLATPGHQPARQCFPRLCASWISAVYFGALTKDSSNLTFNSDTSRAV